jgi:hypothetical protein
MKQDRTLLWLLPVLVAAFALGVARLFQARFESGDVYPPYSSFRADPLGTKALFESLENLRGQTVRRFTAELDKLPEGRRTTLCVFGARPRDMEYSTEDEYKTLEQFMFAGGRIVISFAPANTRPWTAPRAEEQAEKKSKDKTSGNKRHRPGDPDDEEPAPRKKKKPVGDEEDWPGMNPISLKERWHVSFDYLNLPKNADGVYQSVRARRKADRDLPASLVWHTALYFERPGSDWNVIYARDSHPVLIERKFGRGSLVFAADSYFVSNEALRRDRQANLLAWLLGPNTTVLFDETHLGVMETPGVAALIRKYRLHGLAVGLLLLAGLFVWKNAIGFVAPYAEDRTETGADAVAGKDSAAGFVNLLRRGIPPAEVVAVCFAEWKKARAHSRADLAAKAEQMAGVVTEEQARAARDRNPVEAYRRIARLLNESANPIYERKR